jgi:hypothetical protein
MMTPILTGKGSINGVGNFASTMTSLEPQAARQTQTAADDQRRANRTELLTDMRRISALAGVTAALNVNTEPGRPKGLVSTPL